MLIFKVLRLTKLVDSLTLTCVSLVDFGLGILVFQRPLIFVQVQENLVI